MKKLIFATIILLFAVFAYGAEAPVFVKPCPKTTMVQKCLECHVVPTFAVREAAPDAILVYPFPSMKIIIENKEAVGYYLLTDISSSEIKQFLDYLTLHDIKRAVIEIHSPGGGLFDAQRIVSLIRQWQSTGGKVEMRLYGVAFSAGFYIFVSGDVRLVSRDSDLMWHEIQSFEAFGFKVETPSDKEEAARVLRHLQDVRNKYIASRGKLSKAEVDQRVSKKEWWMTGADAVKFGFAEGFLGK